MERTAAVVTDSYAYSLSTTYRLCSTKDKPLEEVYRQAPMKLLHLSSSWINPQPYQLRMELQAQCSCLHGQDPSNADFGSKLLSVAPRTEKRVCVYKRADVLWKIQVLCEAQGDVVLKCIHLEEDLKEEMMFRVMFKTAFIQSQVLMLKNDDIDVLWNAQN